MLGYLTLGCTAMNVHSLALFLNAPITYPRTLQYKPTLVMRTNELVEIVVEVNKFHSLIGMMAYESGNLGVLVCCNPVGWKAWDFYSELCETSFDKKK